MQPRFFMEILNGNKANGIYLVKERTQLSKILYF